MRDESGTPAFGLLRAPSTILFGEGQRAGLPGHASALGSRALVVTDGRMAADPVFEPLVRALRDAGTRVSVFDDVVAELPVRSIQAGVEAARRAGADLVVGIGGGSCLDAAKTIALLAAHGGHPSDYYGELAVPGPVVPLILLPTTSGTGSEVTPVAVVGDEARELKVGISSPHLIARVAICDPELTYGCPPGLTAVSGADALTHAIEALTARPRIAVAGLDRQAVFTGKNVLSDRNALSAIAEISAGLPAAFLDGGDVVARRRLMLGALLAGLAFGAAGTAAAHAVQYPVGALTHTPHGLGVALMMPYVMTFNLASAEAELALVARSMGAAHAGMSRREEAVAAIDAVAHLFNAVGIPARLADIGISEDQLGRIAQSALGISRLVDNNPEPLDARGMLALVRAAHAGDRSTLMHAISEGAAR